MQNMLLFFALCFGAQVFGGTFEDVRDVSGSFNTLLGSPSLEQYKKLKSVAGQTYRFAAKIVPYGEAVAALLKPFFNEEQLEEVLQTTKKIEGTVETIRSEQATFKEELLAYHLHSDYYEKVTTPLRNMFQLLASLNAYKFKPPADLLNDFKSGCRLHYRPQAIAMYLNSIAVNCEQPIIDSKLISQIYEHLQHRDYTKHRSGNDDNWFGIHTSAIYSCLLPLAENQRKQAFVELQHLIASNRLFEESGLYLIRHRLCDEIRRAESTSSACLAKSLFVATEFKYASVLKLAANLLQDYNATIALGIICSNVTNPDNRDVAKLEGDFVLKDLERVNVFISEWFPKLLNGTWSEIESILVKKALKEQANGVNFLRDQTIYDNLLQKLIVMLAEVGSAIYSRQLVIVPSPKSWVPPTEIAYDCMPRTCFLVTGHNVNVYVLRVSLFDENFGRKGSALSQFMSGKEQVFKTVTSELRLKSPSYLIDQLDKTYNFNLQKFRHSNSFYLLIVNYTVSIFCSFPVASFKIVSYEYYLMANVSASNYEGLQFGHQCASFLLIVAA